MSGTTASRVEKLLQELGLGDRMTKVSDTIWSVQKGSATVHVVAGPEYVVATARVADKLPNSNKEGFFKMLLQANVQLTGAFFTLETNDTVRVNQVWPAQWMQAQELAFIIGNVAAKADEWDDRLRALVG